MNTKYKNYHVYTNTEFVAMDWHAFNLFSYYLLIKKKGGSPFSDQSCDGWWNTLLKIYYSLKYTCWKLFYDLGVPTFGPWEERYIFQFEVELQIRIISPQFLLKISGAIGKVKDRVILCLVFMEEGNGLECVLANLLLVPSRICPWVQLCTSISNYGLEFDVVFIECWLLCWKIKRNDVFLGFIFPKSKTNQTGNADTLSYICFTLHSLQPYYLPLPFLLIVLQPKYSHASDKLCWIQLNIWNHNLIDPNLEGYNISNYGYTKLILDCIQYDQFMMYFRKVISVNEQRVGILGGDLWLKFVRKKFYFYGPWDSTVTPPIVLVCLLA